MTQNIIETNPTDENTKKFVQQLLDSYFMFREALPTVGYIQDNKTTQQIQDELEPMYHVTTGNIVAYMTKHGYATVTEPDGSVAWAIWRNINISHNI